ncbi:branched-chain amino acid ABC transporter permease [Kerstersia gyiorum]|jgi:branched-chain amino acid transport system permease protein|uniref:ABC transporter permease n=1 Tax=Kerstersia gyiorum TaxID=206506 RepID=A0A171KPF2_9BURK|nr:branched-chain amino acid ABC transporter permease [Kerstersia gyiorum]AZV93067.1 branched-chain amino acid ABC transporter permease [Bordetella sp. J329]KAB0544370.1 branched-chain amino acid ABC transporter permease [Kerstersia gyiorum]KKO70769.1 ABC transporter permease [Kerstersia gyiorum]MCH4273239.1 branched-chain amino acid ABC transporter permease [Kerstersia gyiorum]MCI1230116.1 branched-chain amino acid ABC transporter permease [Kerstersia gyiorum]
MIQNSFNARRALFGWGGLLVLALLPLLAETIGSPYWVNLATRFLIYGLVAVSLDLVIGYGAMISFGHAMFFAMGGYVVGIISFHTFEAGPLFGWAGSNEALLVWPLALACSALLGLVTGYLALRTRGVQFIMITLAFGQMLYFILVSLQVYGGDDGLLLNERNHLPGVDLSSDTQLYYVCLVLLALWTLLCIRIVNSRFGMVLQALRQSERRAVNLGVAPVPHRLTAFVLSAVGTGLAGVLWANYSGLVTPDMAAWTKSGEFMAIVILGGVGTLLGPIGGAAVFLGLEQALSAVTEHWLLYMGPLLVLVVLLAQRGLFGRLLEKRNGQ